jgi:hypothetical protein
MAMPPGYMLMTPLSLCMSPSPCDATKPYGWEPPYVRLPIDKPQ